MMVDAAMEKMMKVDDGLYSYFCDSIQMYIMGVPFYALNLLLNSTKHTLPHHFSLILVLNGACSGIFIGSVIKFHSMVIRCFVNGMAIVTTVSVSCLFLGEEITALFLGGTACVVVATLLFHNLKSERKLYTYVDEEEGLKTMDEN